MLVVVGHRICNGSGLPCIEMDEVEVGHGSPVIRQQISQLQIAACLIEVRVGAMTVSTIIRQGCDAGESAEVRHVGCFCGERAEARQNLFVHWSLQPFCSIFRVTMFTTPPMALLP